MDGKLFNSVFNNKVIYNIILLQKNEKVFISTRKELLEYKEKEFISKLMYGGDLLEINDLPINGALKKICFIGEKDQLIKGEFIPFGVQKIEFGYNSDPNKETLQLSTLPKSVHTVYGVCEKKQINSIGYDIKNMEDRCIPPNITSISFQNYYIPILRLPNNIKHLKFEFGNKIILKPGDISEGITNLNIIGYNINKVGDGVLPKSTLKLKIRSEVSGFGDFFNFVLPNIKSLKIIIGNDIPINCGLNQWKSIQNLEIVGFYDEYERNKSIGRNSLPPNITNLKLDDALYSLSKNTIPNSVIYLEITSSKCYNIEIDVIPNSVISLCLNINNEKQLIKDSIPPSVQTLKSNIIFTTYKLPQSIKTLKLTYQRGGCKKEDLIKMLTNLPNSITSLILSKGYESFVNDLTFPSTINKIKYEG